MSSYVNRENYATVTLLEAPLLYWLCLATQKTAEGRGDWTERKMGGKERGGVWREKGLSLLSRCDVSHAARIP